ncbi:unnamed protein product [Musa banksii]
METSSLEDGCSEAEKQSPPQWPQPPPAPVGLQRLGSGTSVVLDLEVGVEAESRKLPSSRYKGVVPQPNGRWGAQIYEKHQRVWLGTFNEEDEAARAYDIVDMIRKHTYQDELHQSSRSARADRRHNPPHGATEEGRSGPHREHLFDKAVTPSDVGKLNRLVIPKQHAEKHFPLQQAGAAAFKGVLLSFEDACGKLWRFRYSYWSSSQSYVLTKGWSRFVKEKGLRAGDVITIQRSTAPEKLLFIDRKTRALGRHAAAGVQAPRLPVQVVRLFGVDIVKIPVAVASDVTEGNGVDWNGKRMRDMERLMDHLFPNLSIFHVHVRVLIIVEIWREVECFSKTIGTLAAKGNISVASLIVRLTFLSKTSLYQSYMLLP